MGVRAQRTPRASPTKFPSNSASEEPQDTQRDTSPHKPSAFQTISSKLTSDPSQPSVEIGPGSRVVRLAPFADPESPERGQEGSTGESPPEHLEPSRGCGSPSAGHRAPPGSPGLCAPRLWPAPPRPPPPPRTSSASSRSSPRAQRPPPAAPPNLPAPLAPGARAPHWTDRGRSAPQPIVGRAGGGAHGPGPPKARRLLTNSPTNERRSPGCSRRRAGWQTPWFARNRGLGVGSGEAFREPRAVWTPPPTSHPNCLSVPCLHRRKQFPPAAVPCPTRELGPPGDKARIRRAIPRLPNRRPAKPYPGPEPQRTPFLAAAPFLHLPISSLLSSPCVPVDTNQRAHPGPLLAPTPSALLNSLTPVPQRQAGHY